MGSGRLDCVSLARQQILFSYHLREAARFLPISWVSLLFIATHRRPSSSFSLVDVARVDRYLHPSCRDQVHGFMPPLRSPLLLQAVVPPSMLTALAFLGGSTAVPASAPPFDLAAALADQVSRIPGLALHDLNRSAATLVSPGSEQSVDAKRLAPCVASAPTRLAACFGRAGGQGVALVVDEGRSPAAVRVLSVLPPRALLVILLGGSAARLAEVQQLLDVLNAQFISPQELTQLARQIGLSQIGPNAVARLDVPSCPAEPLPPLALALALYPAPAQTLAVAPAQTLAVAPAPTPSR